MNSGRDPSSLEDPGHGILAVSRNPYGVLGVDTGAILFYDRRDDLGYALFQETAVCLREALSLSELFLKMIKLDRKHGGLKSVEARIEPDIGVPITGALSVDSKPAHPFCQVGLICEDHTSVSVTS